MRADLLALTPEKVAALANLGLVKRAQKEIAAGQGPRLEEAADGATVLVHDLHLSLVGAFLRERRPDLRTAHFAHTPFCWPDGLDVLPEEPKRVLLEGLAVPLLTRAVFVVDKAGKLTHVEYVSEVTHEPNYETALAALKKAA